MNCQQTCDRLGLLLDGESTPGEAEVVKAHLRNCPKCREEWERLQQLAGHLEIVEQTTRLAPPPRLWNAIERQLDQAGSAAGGPGPAQPSRRRLAMAASVALLVGAGLLFTVVLDRSAQTVEASVIDYRILMDGVTADVHAAIDKFLRHYHAQPIDAAQAKAAAPGLSFEIPEHLAGGYDLLEVYRLRFGRSSGVGALYQRGDDPLFVFFHPMSDNTTGPAGTSCLIGELYGSQIQVGPWRLLHIMDATTCHCVLTTLDPGPQLEEVILAVAPDVRAHAPAGSVPNSALNPATTAAARHREHAH